MSIHLSLTTTCTSTHHYHTVECPPPSHHSQAILWSLAAVCPLVPSALLGFRASICPWLGYWLSGPCPSSLAPSLVSTPPALTPQPVACNPPSNTAPFSILLIQPGNLAHQPPLTPAGGVGGERKRASRTMGYWLRIPFLPQLWLFKQLEDRLCWLCVCTRISALLPSLLILGNLFQSRLLETPK